MYEIDRPEYLNLMWIIPLLWLVFILHLARAKKQQKALASVRLFKSLVPSYSVSRQVLSYVLLSLSMVFLSFSLANPKIGISVEKVKRQGSDIVFALDASLSMLAEDQAPNRLEKARQIINSSIDKMGGDRIGIIIYAGSAYPLLPITNDYAAAKMFLKSVSPDMLSSQGTSIADAIQLSERYFDKPNIKNKLLVIISDGEDHQSDDRALETAKLFKEKGVKIYTVGIGKMGGGPIPIKKDGRVEEYKKDRSGNVVITKLNEYNLIEIAHAGGGEYIGGNSTKAVVDMVEELLGTGEKNDYGETLITTYKDRYQIFLAIAIALLVAQALMSFRAGHLLSRLRLIKHDESEVFDELETKKDEK